MSPSSSGVEVTATRVIRGGAVGVTASEVAASLSPFAPLARSSKVWAVPLASLVTVNPDAWVPPGALFAIRLQAAG